MRRRTRRTLVHDRRNYPHPAAQALVKTAAGQATLFPLYTTLFFTYMGLLEGLTPAQVRGPPRPLLSRPWLAPLRPQCSQRSRPAS